MGDPLRVVLASIRAQVQMSNRSVEDLLPLITMPLYTLVFMAIFIYAGRRDLTGYALVAPLLITVAQMSIFVASEVIVRERYGGTIELIVATPASFTLIIWARVAVLTSLGLVGFFESWLLAKLAFDVSVTVHHLYLLVATLLLTSIASASTALITSVLISFTRSQRAFQNVLTFPLYLMSGVLVPVTFLPSFLQPFSHLLFLYWAANLLRDSFQPAPPTNPELGLAAIALLAIGAGVLGTILIERMITHLKREGTLGLV
jgi:ABC-2 type transport system permease protein